MASQPSPTPRRVLITGANRGIGIELARTFIAAGHQVWGSARTGRAENLQAIGPAGTIEMDLADEASVVAALDSLAAHVDGLDVLINCAGVDARAFGTGDRPRGPFDLDADTFNAVNAVNVTGPMVVTRQALPLLRAGTAPIVVNISSQLGSMEFAKGAGNDTAYCVSKAALNMLSVKSAAALQAEAICVVTMHPGWVSTDMGGPSAPLSPTESATAIHETVLGLSMADSGRFVTWDGRDHAW